MPWMETSVGDERLHFIRDFESGHWSMTELCERYGGSMAGEQRSLKVLRTHDLALPWPAQYAQRRVWWMELGIVHQRITPASPQENGQHERMHRELKRETARRAATNH